MDVQSVDKNDSDDEVQLYFSENQWKAFSVYEKLRFATIKKNYDNLVAKGLNISVPKFMLQKKRMKMTPSVRIESKSKPQEKLSEDNNNPHRRWINHTWNEKDNKLNESDKKTLLLEYAKKNLERLYELRASIKQKLLQYGINEESDLPQRYSKRNVSKVSNAEEDVSSDDDSIHCDPCDKQYDQTSEQIHDPLIHISDNEITNEKDNKPNESDKKTPSLLLEYAGKNLERLYELRASIKMKLLQYRKGPESDHPQRYSKRNVPKVTYTEEDVSSDDDSIHFDRCDKQYDRTCEQIHGALIHILDNEVSPGKRFAWRTCPVFLSMGQSSIKRAGLGVWTKINLVIGVVFGPYKGTLVKNAKEARSSGYTWEIYRRGRVSHLIEGSDTTISNWMRFVNCATCEERQNLAAFQYKGEIYYRTYKSVKAFSELLVWYGDEYGANLGIYRHEKEQVQNDIVKEREIAKDNALPSMICYSHKSLHETNGVRNNKNISPTISSKISRKRKVNRATQKKTVQIHMDGVHFGKKLYKCDVCDYSASQKKTVQIHMDGVHFGKKPYKCDICDYSASQKKTVQIHMDGVHFGKKPYKCDICDYSATQKIDVQSHMDGVHFGKKPFKCEICDYSATRKTKVKKHMDAVHFGKKPYKCDICDYSAAQMVCVQRHMDGVHYGKKPYKCEICEYCATRKADVIKHMDAVHFGKKPYKCDICDYNSTRKELVQRHMNAVHFGRKPYKCDICDYRAVQKSDIKRHTFPKHERKRPEE